MAKSIMIQGTASGVGKTILTLALCRIFAQDGFSVAPFKAQNMTGNIHKTDAGEIAISQWLQALAAGVQPTTDMNPIILTPGQNGTEIVLNGKRFGTIGAHNYMDVKERLRLEVIEAYSRLAKSYDVIVIEGAGSPVELNLSKNDIVNMGMAKIANSPVIMVADIDRGGVFASLYGTISLLDEESRAWVKATVVNRFRGEVAYFSDGVKILEDITQLPVAGVVPYMEINLPEEDGLFQGHDAQYDYGSQFDNIASHVRASLDMGLVHKILNDGV